MPNSFWLPKFHKICPTDQQIPSGHCAWDADTKNEFKTSLGSRWFELKVILVINLAKRGKVLGIQVSKRRVQRETTRKLESASESAETRKKRDSLNESTRRHPVLEKRISSNAL